MREPPEWLTGRGVLYAGILGHLFVGGTHLTLDALREHYVGHLQHYLFEVVVLVGLPVAMLVLLRRLERADLREPELWGLVRWGVAGMAGSFLVTGLSLGNAYAMGTAVPSHLVFSLILAADVGAVFGLLIGRQELRSRRSTRRAERAEARAELAERHEERLSFLNRILRHHVLNAASVVLGATSNLREDADEEQRATLDTIERRSHRMVTYVEDIRDVLRTLSGDVTPRRIDLATVLNREVETAGHAYPEADVEVSLPGTLPVIGSELTGVAFANLLENAVKHNDRATPAVWIDAAVRDGTVRVTIEDDGPGIRDDLKTAYFARGDHGARSIGEGLGLYLAETVLGTTGGEIRIEDNEPRGTRVVVALERAVGDDGEASPRRVEEPTRPGRT